jgi:hypothetical protein
MLLCISFAADGALVLQLGRQAVWLRALQMLMRPWAIRHRFLGATCAAHVWHCS